MTSGKRITSGRIRELDAVRGLAAILVVLYHLWSYKFYFGWAAVDLFFVLSGFLITSIILKNCGGKGFLLPFYSRRGLRIWPIYYLAILALILVNRFLPSPYHLREGLPYYLTYTQNLWLYAFKAGPNLRPLAHTWTLAVEEQFYVFWPLLIWLFGRRSVIALCALFTVVPVGARLAGFHPHLLLSHCDGFALGGFLAAIMFFKPEAASRSLSFPLICLLACLGAVGYFLIGGHIFRGKLLDDSASPGGPWPGPTILALNVLFVGVVGLLICFRGSRWLAVLRMRWLVYLGEISYGLYLYHFILIKIVGQIVEYSGTARTTKIRAAEFFASILLAALSWEIIEKPILRLKNRMSYRGVVLPKEDVASVGELQPANRRRRVNAL